MTQTNTDSCGPNMTERAAKTFDQRQISDAQVTQIESIKQTASVLWDKIDNISVPPGNSEAGRLVSLAKTELETTVLWAVKAISRQ